MRRSWWVGLVVLVACLVGLVVIIEAGGEAGPLHSEDAAASSVPTDPSVAAPTRPRGSRVTIDSVPLAGPNPAHPPAPAAPAPKAEGGTGGPNRDGTLEKVDVASAAPLLEKWQPPTPSDAVFDLNADRSVGADEQSRAREILELAKDFAHDRTRDGSFPILKDAFDGDPRFFTAMDLDADGALSEREFVSFHVDSIRQVRRFDQNHDGALTVAEFGALPSRYEFLDVDHDGLLWAWEISIQRGRGKW